ncbi:MAG TPA: exosortase/archaeosortase family protein [Lacunisphaera sp.]|nr:exosortase/archaeosortase family protein [Lacunisphaera sp.]
MSAAAAPRHWPRGTWALAVALGALCLAYCLRLWPEWRANPDLSHGFFAPFVFALLVWESRRLGPLRWLHPGAWRLPLLAAALIAGFASFALAGLIAASLGWPHALVLFLLALSLAAFLFAGLLLLADASERVVPFNWVSLTAILLLILVAPLPVGTYSRLTLTLQHGVTGSVIHTLQLLGVPARQHGNVIELARTTVGVEEACSGIRSLLSCVYAGFFFAAWQVRRPLRRAVLIVAAPLLALAMNFVRSLLLTLLVNAGTDIAGFWHDATGYAILGVTAVVLGGLAVLMESAAPAPEVAAAAAPTPPAPASRRLFWCALSATAILAAFYILSSRPALREGRPAPDLGALLPAEAPGWEVFTPKDLYQFAGILSTTHLVERTYVRKISDTDFIQLTVYVAYWAAGQASVSRVASHTPDACWPGAGWSPRAVTDTRQSPVMAGVTLAPGEYRLFEDASGFRQNVWFWHIYDGRTISYQDPYSVPALLRLALRYGFRRQGDQLFIRISSNKPWPELAQEPLLRQIIEPLVPLGL